MLARGARWSVERTIVWVSIARSWGPLDLVDDATASDVACSFDGCVAPTLEAASRSVSLVATSRPLWCLRRVLRLVAASRLLRWLRSDQFGGCAASVEWQRRGNFGVCVVC